MIVQKTKQYTEKCRCLLWSLKTYIYYYLQWYLIPLISYVVFVSFSLWSEFLKPNTYYLSLIDLFDQCENSVFARENTMNCRTVCIKVAQSLYVTMTVSINHLHDYYKNN